MVSRTGQWKRDLQIAEDDPDDPHHLRRRRFQDHFSQYLCPGASSLCCQSIQIGVELADAVFNGPDGFVFSPAKMLQ